jgi:hypothetical protein
MTAWIVLPREQGYYVNVGNAAQTAARFAEFDAWASANEAAQIVAVGSTALSGDSALDAKYPPLTWEKFSRDLRVARHFAPVVGIYSLEGCVRQGFMPRLKAMDWSEPVVISAASVEQATQFRAAVRAVLWVASRLLYFVVALLLVFAWLVRVMVRWRRRRPPLPSRSSGFATSGSDVRATRLMVRPLAVSTFGSRADAGCIEHDLVDTVHAEVAFDARVRKGGRAKGRQAHPRRGQAERLTDVPGFE